MMAMEIIIGYFDHLQCIKKHVTQKTKTKNAMIEHAQRIQPKVLRGDYNGTHQE